MNAIRHQFCFCRLILALRIFSNYQLFWKFLALIIYFGNTSVKACTQPIIGFPEKNLIEFRVTNVWQSDGIKRSL